MVTKPDESRRGRPRRRTATGIGVGAFAVVLATVIAVANWRAIMGEIRLWRNFRRMGTNQQGFVEYSHRRSGLVFVRIPGGEMLLGPRPVEMDIAMDEIREEMMGSGAAWARGPVWFEERLREEQERCRSDAGGLRRVRVEAFLMAKTELTQKDWSSVMPKNPSLDVGNDLPVHAASWRECSQFCAEMEFSLPSRYQWEFARRLALERQGADPAESARRAHLQGRRNRRPRSVASTPPDGCGLHDMAGNVAEFCVDAEPGLFDPARPADETGVYVKGGARRFPLRSFLPGLCMTFRASTGVAGVGFRPVFNVRIGP